MKAKESPEWRRFKNAKKEIRRAYGPLPAISDPARRAERDNAMSRARMDYDIARAQRGESARLGVSPAGEGRDSARPG